MTSLLIVVVTCVLILGIKILFPGRFNRWVASDAQSRPGDGFLPSLSPEQILDAVPAGILVLRSDRTIQYASSAVSDWLKVPRENLIGRPLGEFTPEDADLDDLLKESNSPNTAPFQNQLPLPAENGPTRPIEMLIQPLRGPNNRYYVCMIPDPTTESDFPSGSHTTRLSTLGEMVSGLAHELNNPLTGVVGFSNLLLEEEGTDEYHEELSIIQQNAERCKKIVNHILDFARDNSADIEELDVNDVIAQATGMVQRELDRDDIEINQDLDPELPSLQANPVELEEVFVNLITNAQQELSSQDIDDKQIRVQTLPGEDCIVIHIEDNGGGLSEDLRERIFEPFYTTKEAGEGTGLGLPISRGIVRELGGAISVDDSELGGARFTIKLPVDVEPGNLESHQTRWNQKADLPEFVSRVLVVDDERSIRELLRKELERQDVQVELFQNPLQAIDYLAHGNPGYEPDFILLDLTYPGKLEGRDFYSWLESFRPDLIDRLILMTGNPETAQLDFRTDESIPLLTKPISISDIADVLSNKTKP